MSGGRRIKSSTVSLSGTVSVLYVVGNTQLSVSANKTLLTVTNLKSVTVNLDVNAINVKLFGKDFRGFFTEKSYLPSNLFRKTPFPVKRLDNALKPQTMEVPKIQKPVNLAPNMAVNAVLLPSQELPAETPTVSGFDWENGTDYNKILESYTRSGFQATNFGKTVSEINNMLKTRSVPLTEENNDPYEEDVFIKKKTNCTIFLGYTSNMISSGLRDTIRFLIKNNLVDCIVTTAGGVEEDLIKCLAPTYVGDFNLSGKALRNRGINRIGNLLVPNDNYCKFEEWVTPLLDEMLDEQVKHGTIWSPSRIISRLGERINDESSVCYWAWKNNIPIFSPALTDGSLGDMMYFHSYKRPGLVIDILSDLRRLNTMAVKANNTGMIILGGGVIKHHICNANLMRNGADYAVYVNTACEFDGSDAGARPDEAVSWGKIRPNATPVKLYADATLVFPLIVAQTFAKYYFGNKKNV